MNNSTREKINGIFEGFDVKRFEKIGEDLVKKVNPLFQQIQSEHAKLAKPKSKKNIQWDGKGVGVSLIEDGRILINFSTMDEAEKFYNEFENIKTSEEVKLIQKFSDFYRSEGLKTSNRYLHVMEELNELNSNKLIKFLRKCRLL